MPRTRMTVDSSPAGDFIYKGAGFWNSAKGEWSSDLSVVLPTNNRCVGAKDGKNTGLQHLVLPNADLRKDGAETGRVSFRFQMMVGSTAMTQAGAGGFTILQWGVSGVTGTLTLSYVPISNFGGNIPPHSLVATVAGDAARTVTVPIYECDQFIQVFLEYDGTALTLVCGESADQFVATSEIPPATSPNTLQFGADIKDLFFMDLQVFNAALMQQVTPTATSFPYILWDAEDSGVIGVLPTPTIPPDYFVFLDRGYTTGHQPGSFDLTTGNTINSVTLWINERPTVLGFTGGTAAQFITWLTTINSGLVSFDFDGKSETLKFEAESATSVRAYHVRGAKEGQLSFAVRFEGSSPTGSVQGGSWGKTVALLGKIPQQWSLPHTGEPNRGISILGASKSMATPKSISVEYRDDNVRTVGKVIGDVANRPGAGLALTRLTPVNFFGSGKAPFPKDALIYGNPNTLGYHMQDTSIYSYGLLWERFLQVQPGDVKMRQMPFNRSRAGDTFAAFSIDIPLGQTLRGININFTSAPPALRGNIVTADKFAYNWGEGPRQFPFVLTGNPDYTCLFYPLIAVDDEATEWRTIPSIGADAVKVSGANVWKEIQFRSTDFDNLKDKNGLPLLMGARRVHFKLVLAHEVTHVTYQGMSYRMQSVPKK